MNTLLQVTLVNAGCAALLALAVALVGKHVKRPAVLHALWILVLLQLFMPPVFEIGLLPGPAPLQRSTPLRLSTVVHASVPANSLAGDVRSAGVSTPLPPTTPDAETTVPLTATPPGVGELVTTIWIAGTLWMLGLVLVRTGRFRRLLRVAGSTDAALERRLARLARRMGVRKPGLRLVHASVSPLIRPRLSGAELLFPAELLDRLDTGEQEAILAHELAHIARRDHWVRLLELIAVSLFWWHPAVWWARSRLRLAEERCCDQLVMQTLPRGRSSYARGLLKTVEFLAGTKAGVPALASGIGEIRDLKERLTMILKDRPPKSMSRIQRTLLALCAASVLLIFPTWSDRDLQAAPSDDTATEYAGETSLANAEREYVNQRLELEQQALHLEYALREVREQQAELDQLWHDEMRSSELDEMRVEEHRARAEGAHDRAEEMYERALALNRRAERERREQELDRLRAEAYEQREAGRTELAERIEAEVEALRRRNTEERIRRELELRSLQEALHRELSQGGTQVH